MSITNVLKSRTRAKLPVRPPRGRSDHILSTQLSRRMLSPHGSGPCATRLLFSTAVVPYHDAASATGEHPASEEGRQPNSSVGVFWDYENCAVDSESSMLRLSALRRLAKTFGRKITMKVYLDRAQLAAPRATAIRSRLYAAGFELVDCPHDGMKEVIDKAITVDMFMYALDNPAPSTLLLISGDRGYAPMLSRLSLRGYNIIIVTPITTANAGLRLAQCHSVYEWSDQLTLLQSQELEQALPRQPPKKSAKASQATFTPIRTSKKLPEGTGFFSSSVKPTTDTKSDTATSSRPTSVRSSEKQPYASKSPKNAGPSHMSIEVDPMFQALVDILKANRSEGVLYLSSSALGQMLPKKNPNVFGDAGVSKLKEYTILAEEKQIIVFKSDKSGPIEKGSDRFISLHPRLL